MKPLIAIALITFMGSHTQAAELTIVDVRKNIPLSDSEPAYKDFYLAGASVSALKKNMVVTAVRKSMIRDSRGTQSYGEIEIPVGQLRILGLFGDVAIAREYKLLSRDEHPMLEQVGLMSGDRIELKGSFIDNKPLPKPKAVSEIEVPAEPRRETASLPTTPPAPTESAAPSVVPSAPAPTTPEPAPKSAEPASPPETSAR